MSFSDRFSQFFEDGSNQLSMTRLLCFLSFFPSTWVVLTTASDHIETIFAIYIGAFVASYIGGKFSERIRIGPPPVNIEQSGPGDMNVSK